MPYTQPSRSDVHVNRPLSNISVAYLQSSDAFVAAKVFPNIPVSKQSDAYFTYDRGEFNRDEMEIRNPGTESAGGTYKIGTETYYAPVRAFHKDIPDQVRANADDPINLDREAAEYVTQKALISRERDWAAKYFTAGAPGATWTFDVDGAAAKTADSSFNPTEAANNNKLYWNDSSSTPIEDIRQGKRYVQESTGFRPNILTVGRAVFDVLMDHSDIVGRIDRGQTDGTAMVNRNAIAAIFELDEILVMDSIYNTTKEGQTASHSFIGGKHALLSYRPPTPGLLTPSAGYTFGWNGFTGASDEGMRIKRFYMNQIESDRVEIDMAYDQKVVSKDLGYFFGGIVQ